MFGKQAIENALERRGLSETYDLEFQVFARCTLYHKDKSPEDTLSQSSFNHQPTIQSIELNSGT